VTILTSCPRDFKALQKELVKSPAAPVRENGETSLDMNKTFSVISQLRLVLTKWMSMLWVGGLLVKPPVDVKV